MKLTQIHQRSGKMGLAIWLGLRIGLQRRQRGRAWGKHCVELGLCLRCSIQPASIQAPRFSRWLQTVSNRPGAVGGWRTPLGLGIWHDGYSEGAAGKSYRARCQETSWEHLPAKAPQDLAVVAPVLALGESSSCFALGTAGVLLRLKGHS